MTLVDTSVWIDGFRGGESKEALKKLIDNGSICINDIILAESSNANRLEWPYLYADGKLEAWYKQGRLA